MGMAYTIGVDLGASSVKVCALPRSCGGEGPAAPLYCGRAVHYGDALGALRSLLVQAAAELAGCECVGIAATGSGAELLCERAAAGGLELLALEDIPAIAQGAAVLAPQARTVLEIGGQNARFVTHLGEGRVPEFSMNEGCASGTGSFFEDQMARLGMSIEDFSDVVSRARSVPRISGRCAVFAKTDIIHRQQEGAPVEDILLGLCYAMARSFKALIVRGAKVEKPVALSGGVLLNQGFVRAVRAVFGLAGDELLVTKDNLYIQAAGAAVAAREGAGLRLEDLADALSGAGASGEVPRLSPLPDEGYVAGLGYDLLSREQWETGVDGLLDVTLGVDVGSTSTDLVLLDQRGRIVDAQYLRTRGDASAAAREGLASLGTRLGSSVRVRAVCTTGSGRALVGRLIGADAVRDEITAQARGAAAADPAVDTVFEIGGQDSKYVSLAYGEVVDFQMNKVCAAGTGSFVEEQAARLGIPIDTYGPLALSSEAPVDLGERCTVFVETAIGAALAAGAERRDIAAGLCESVVTNYLNRVVGSKTVGNHVVLQGGVAYNSGIVAAFRARLGERLSVSPWFAVSGAVGAALLARDVAESPGFAGTSFLGFDLEGRGGLDAVAGSTARKREERIEANRAFYAKTEQLFLAGYTPERDPARKTVGVPRCLMLHRLFPMVNAFFRTLGYNVVLTDNTTSETIARAQELARGETCYPVKLVYGHMAQLADMNVDYVFMPSMHTIRHATSKVAHNYACLYMQTAPSLVARALDFEERGIKLINPLLDMDFGQEALATAMLGVGTGLGHAPEETARAMLAGGFAVTEFGRATEALGEELLGELGPNERVLVLVTRNYGISDDALNMGIPDIILDRGWRVITLGHLHGHDLDLSADHPELCWPFGQHILSGAKLIRRDPRLFAVYLTNHGCGPDTMLSHLFREEMGPKPYLQIEVDEHASSVGVITRVEAFLNALEHYSVEDAVRDSALGVGNLASSALCEPRLEQGLPVSVPGFGAHSRLVAAWLRSCGFDAWETPVGAAQIEAGRSETVSKEYLTFTALAGWALDQAGEWKRAGAAGQLLVPSTCGAEADNQYARVIASVMERRGAEPAPRVISSQLETLPWRVLEALGQGACDALVLAILAADLAYALPAGERGEYLADAEARAEAGALDVAWLYEQARRCDARGDAAASSIGVVGEWPLVYSDSLSAGVWRELEREGRRLVRMPLAECLLMAWTDEYEVDRSQGSRAGASGMPWEAACGEGSGSDPFAVAPGELARRGELLDRWRSWTYELSGALGEASPFSDLNRLRGEADELAGSLRGGFSRYRAAKLKLLGERCGSVITVSSMYENADTVLRLAGDDVSSPVLHLSFDGSLDQGIWERLRSFLYYVG